MVFGFIGTTEVVIILIIALLVFGPQKIPEISRQIGSAYRELNKMRGEVSRALEFESYVQPYDMPPYEPAPGTTYPQDTYNSGYDYDSDREYNALHQALAVPPPGPTLGPNVTPRSVEANVVDVVSEGESESFSTDKSAEIGAATSTTESDKA
jgi:sec-independent protein translocase protein TatA